MSKLEELIQQCCPDGVEWKPLTECCNILDGKRKPITKGARQSGPYPYYGANGIQDWVADYIFDGTYVLIGEDGSVITPNGTPIVNWAHGKIWVNNHAHIIAEKTGVLLRFLFYYIQIIDIHNLVHGNIPKLTQGDLKELEIPVPPLPVQEEIVRILDTFTELQAELQAELQKRKQQYSYYLDNLLSFNNINRGGYQAEVRWMKMSDIGTFYSGLSGKTKEDFQNGNAKFISYVNIFNNPSLITDVDDRVKIFEGERQNTIQYGDLLFTGSSETPDECGMCSVLTHHTEEKLYLNSFCFGFRFNDLSGINPEFMKFLFRSSVIRKLICKTANGVTRFNISKKEFAKIVIPIPSLAEQDHIASVLDKFYFLVGDLTIGLPAEIEKRRQQYEYYRDKLLTFKRKGA